MTNILRYNMLLVLRQMEGWMWKDQIRLLDCILPRTLRDKLGIKLLNVTSIRYSEAGI